MGATGVRTVAKFDMGISIHAPREGGDYRSVYYCTVH